MKLRFAPSPTGHLHVGNARVALANWLMARRHGGEFVLRLDDTDTERSKPEFAQGIEEDLRWLGLDWDSAFAQTSRLENYAAAAEKLKASGRLYPCFESEEELAFKREQRRRAGKPPLYDRAALRITPEQLEKALANGKTPYWRFQLSPRTIEWRDGVLGERKVKLTAISDPVLIRADGSFLYTFTSVVDDLETHVSDIVRGEDHVTNTGVQIEIIEALGGVPATFGHHNLLTLPSGEGLSKRLGHLSLRALREEGEEALAVAALAVLTGTSMAVEAVPNLDALAARIDFSKISRAPARLDPAELTALTAQTLHHLSFADVAGRLAALGVGGGEPFWLAVRGNLGRLADAATWWAVVEGPIDPMLDPADAGFLAESAELLPEEPWDAEVYARWIASVKPASGRAGKALFHPLRLALTGASSGPELKALLPLIGRSRAQARLRVGKV